MSSRQEEDDLSEWLWSVEQEVRELVAELRQHLLDHQGGD